MRMSNTEFLSCGEARTFSPTSVRSPLGNISRSGSRHESAIAFQYLSSSKGRPKQTFSLMVAFYARRIYLDEAKQGVELESQLTWIQALCEQ